MLGRLARWLRLLGHDTLYYPDIDDSLLLRIAREEDRMLLTRDTRLVKVRGLKDFLLLDENDPFEQLKKVITTFNLSPAESRLYNRCSLCNSLLDTVPKEQVKDLVPKYVYLTTESFKKCMKCEKCYWEGTHQERLREKLRDVIYGD